MAQNGGFVHRRLTSTGREYGAIHGVFHKTVGSYDLFSASFSSALTGQELQLQRSQTPRQVKY